MSIRMSSSSGNKVTIPRLSSTGIVISDYCLTYPRSDEGHLFAAERMGEYEGQEVVFNSTHRVFRRGKHETALRRATPESIQLYEITATLQNLRALVRLPLVDEDSVAKAIELLYRWGVAMERGCLGFLINKSQTRLVAPELNRDGLTRSPVRLETRSVQQLREFTPREIARARAGHPLPDREERLITVDQEVSEEVMTEWRSYARGGYFPYSHQVLGANLIYLIKRMMVWYDMRTGKTLTMMMAFQRLLEEGEVELIVIVCPTTNAYDPWEPELMGQGFDVVVLDGTPEEDEARIAERSKHNDSFFRSDLKHSGVGAYPTVYVINYERVGSRLPMMEDHWVLPKIAVGMDETSLIKNPRSQRTKALHELCNQPAVVVTLNGTPMEQGPQDVWAQAKCVDQYGVIWGRTFEEFADNYLVKYGPNTWVPKDRMKYEMLLATTSIRVVRSEADQFVGKDQAMRYVELHATQQMIEQSDNVVQGFIKVADADGETGEQEVSKNKLAVYGFLREICCGYDKYREIEAGPYIRSRHEINPKVLWIQCYIASNPTTPLVIFCEFTEIEDWIKQMLNENDIKWSGTKTLGAPTTLKRIVADISVQDRASCMGYLISEHERLVAAHGEDAEEVWDLPYNEESLRYHEVAIAWFEEHRYSCVETYYGPGKGRKYTSQERRQQTQDFNEGRSHVFICKTSEARGISLHRKPAVMNGIGTWPDMIHTAPCWSLGMWDQAGDRCVVMDPRTKKNVCTMRYCLIIKGSIEEKIMGALRSKKNVQASLQRDMERVGYSNFVQDLVTGMISASDGTDGDTTYFDADDIQARIYCGMPPYSKLTQSNLLGKVTELLLRKNYITVKNKKDAVKWLEQEPTGSDYCGDSAHDIRFAYKFLNAKAQEES